MRHIERKPINTENSTLFTEQSVCIPDLIAAAMVYDVGGSTHI
jgi:hypothetical protein